MTGDFVYVSGQGPVVTDGKASANFEQQVEETLASVKNVLAAAKLTAEHVVLATVYLADMKNYAAMNKVYARHFGAAPPARVTVGVSRLPRDIGVEISAIAVRDPKLRKPIAPASVKDSAPATPAIEVADRVFLTSVLGRNVQTGRVPRQPRAQVETMVAQAEAVLKGVNLELRHLAHATVYVTPRMNRKVLEEVMTELIPSETARTVIQTDSLPDGANIALAGVAARSFRRMGRCNQLGETLYCTGRTGTIRQALNELKADLNAAGSDLSQAVYVTVSLADMSDFAAMNKVYAGFFDKAPPARATVQPWKSVTELAVAPATGEEAKPDDSPRAEVNLIALKPERK
jgi:2-iminobutanoate/2-iminopropanoate deaminase